METTFFPRTKVRRMSDSVIQDDLSWSGPMAAAEQDVVEASRHFKVVDRNRVYQSSKRVTEKVVEGCRLVVTRVALPFFGVWHRDNGFEYILCSTFRRYSKTFTERFPHIFEHPVRRRCSYTNGTRMVYCRIQKFLGVKSYVPVLQVFSCFK